MARRKSIKPTKPKMTYKSFMRQLSTWEKRNPSMAKQIKGIAEMFGLLTKTGKISRNKRKLKQYNQFIEEYRKKFGSYTSFMKRFSEKKIGLKRPKGMSKKEYVLQAYKMDMDLEQFFKEVYNLKGREIAIEEYDYIKTLTITEYNDYVNDTLRKYRQIADNESSVTSFDDN